MALALFDDAEEAHRSPPTSESAPSESDSYYDELASEPDIESDHMVEDEQGVDYDVFTDSMLELLGHWIDGFTTQEYAATLFALVEAIIGPADLFNVSKKRDARRSLSELKQPQDVTCIVEMPTSDAITRFDLWFENFTEEEVVEIAKPPPQLLVQPPPTVELSRVPPRERKASVVSTQLSRHYFTANSRPDCDLDVKNFLTCLIAKQRTEETRYLRDVAAEAVAPQKEVKPRPQPVLKIRVARPEKRRPGTARFDGQSGDDDELSEAEDVVRGGHWPKRRECGGRITVQTRPTLAKTYTTPISTGPSCHRAGDKFLDVDDRSQHTASRLDRDFRKAQQKLARLVDKRRIEALVDVGVELGSRGSERERDDGSSLGEVGPATAATGATSAVDLETDSRSATTATASSPRKLRPSAVARDRERHRSFASAESSFVAKFATGELKFPSTLPPPGAVAGLARPGFHKPETPGRKHRSKSAADLALPRKPLAEDSALKQMFRQRIPPQIDDLVLKRNKILDAAPVLSRYVVDPDDAF